MFNTEIAEAIQSVNVFEMAQKTVYAPVTLTEDEKKVADIFDPYIKKMGSGVDPNCEIAAFLQRTLQDEMYNAPDEILDMMFERKSIGEFDAIESTFDPKNKLIAYEAAKGGTVPRSFLDISRLTPVIKNLQVETDISYTDIRKGGWKTFALLVDYANMALKNKMFNLVFNALDAAILSSADNYINETTTSPTESSMDAVATYINDRTQNGSIITLTKWITKINKLSSASDEMKNELNRTGKLGHYLGVPLMGISGAAKLPDGTLQIPDRRVFGIAGKIGTLDMMGDVNVYQTPENQKQVYHIAIKDCTFAYAFNADTLEKVCKMVIAAPTT